MSWRSPSRKRNSSINETGRKSLCTQNNWIIFINVERLYLSWRDFDKMQMVQSRKESSTHSHFNIFIILNLLSLIIRPYFNFTSWSSIRDIHNAGFISGIYREIEEFYVLIGYLLFLGTLNHYFIQREFVHCFL